MADSERRKRGAEMLKEVYAGDVAAPPPGMPFVDLMLEHLFAERRCRQGHSSTPSTAQAQMASLDPT